MVLDISVSVGPYCKRWLYNYELLQSVMWFDNGYYNAYFPYDVKRLALSDFILILNGLMLLKAATNPLGINLYLLITYSVYCTTTKFYIISGQTYIISPSNTSYCNGLLIRVSFVVLGDIIGVISLPISVLTQSY